MAASPHELTNEGGTAVQRTFFLDSDSFNLSSATVASWLPTGATTLPEEGSAWDVVVQPGAGVRPFHRVLWGD